MKKGNAFLETIFIVIVLFIFGFISIFGYRLLTDVNSQIANDNNIDNSTKVQLSNLEDRQPVLFDNLFIVILVLLWIGSLIASFNIDTHPIFFAVMIFLLIFAIFIVGVLGDTFVTIASGSDLSTASAQFPKTTWLMDNIVFVAVGIAFSVLLAMYGRSQ